MKSSASFDSFGLSSAILRAVADKAYKSPSPIQVQAIPIILQGKDLMAAAQTGTGKTASFVLPILQKFSEGGLHGRANQVKANQAKANQARVLILAPTRELAAQIGESVNHYAKHLPLNSSVVYGGVKINPQMMMLRGGVDILIATPGRLLDLYRQNAVKFEQLEILVLDEADRMLDLGFINDIHAILNVLPKQRQNLLFSATFSDAIRKLARGLLNKPLEISVSPRNTTTTSVQQWICPVDKKQKPALLLSLIKDNNWQQVLVFCKTKKGADKLTRFLGGAGINAAAIHGDKSQSIRSRALADFKQQTVQVLIATDIAARGIDIDQLPQVVNFDLPTVAENYIHRIGRTGRAGESGQAVSFVCADEFDALTDIEHLINTILKRKLIDGFEPKHDVPESRLWRKPKKIKKPKKSKVKQNMKGEGNSDNQSKRDSSKKAKAEYKHRGKKKYRPTKLKENEDGMNPPKRKFKQKKRSSH